MSAAHLRGSNLDLGKVAVLGATGAVGREALSILHARGVPAARVVALASQRSAGTSVPYGDDRLVVREAHEAEFRGIDFAILCATADASRRWASVAQTCGATVIDNSSAFRLRDDVPLIVPEVNGDSIGPGHTRIANPNCSTIILLVAMNPIREAFGIAGITVSTYQAVSGAGAAALDELREQAAATLAGQVFKPKVFHEPCAFNVFSHNSRVEPDTGVNGEERKMIEESRKIWGDPNVRITPTCVRVPVFRAHTESVTVTLGRAASETEIRALLSRAPGLRVVDDRAANSFPTTLGASGGDEVMIGRIRPDPSESHIGAGSEPDDAPGRWKSWCFLIVGDQIRKGAALNAVQIAERVVSLRSKS